MREGVGRSAGVCEGARRCSGEWELGLWSAQMEVVGGATSKATRSDGGCLNTSKLPAVE
jgi:hypothetical protein